MKRQISRRDFQKSLLTAGAIAGFSAIKPTMRVLGANDRIRVGFIGTANRGGQVMDAFMKHQDCEIIALCDVHEKSLEKGRQILGKKVDEYKDFRKLLERKDMDAVAIVTPDHWHAIQFIAAAKAGFDIYCEKPFGHTIFEGRKMVEAARKYKIVAQVGSQRRTNEVYLKAFEEIKSQIHHKLHTDVTRPR